MSSCINVNINSPEWKAIVNKIGQFEAVRDYLEHDRIRSVEEVMNSKPDKFLQETNRALQPISTKEINNLQNTVEYQLIVEQDDDLIAKGGQSYVYLNEKDASRFSYILEKTKQFPKEFKVTKKITKYERISNTQKYNSYNEYVDFYYIKLNNNKKSNLYQIVNKETGEIIAEKVRVLHLSKDSKSEIAKKYGLEFTPTKVFSANRSIAFALYRQKPSKAKYIAQAKKYLYDAIKFLNPEETNLKINLDKIEELLNSFPQDMWDYINTTYYPEDSTNVNASINIQKNIKFNLPKLGLLEAVEKITGIKLQGATFRNYDRSGGIKKVLRVEWGDEVTIDYTKLTSKQLKKAISYYLKSKNYFNPSSEEQNVRKYAEHRGIDYNELKKLVFGDIDEAIENIAYNTTGNSDEMEVSKWREYIRNYDWQSVELFSKPYENFQNTVKERIQVKFKDKTLSNGISHLDYFFSGNFNWLNINFNNISGQYYEADMETEADTGFDVKQLGILNPFEVKTYKSPKPGKNFLQEKEVFNRLAAVLHEPFHALHALSYGSKEELELRKAFDNLYRTDFGREMMNQVFGSGYNKNQQVSYDTLYKEFTAFTTQLMLYPKQWINKTDLRSNDIAEYILKIQSLQDKTYNEIVKTQQKIGTAEKTITEEEQIKLSFLEKLYNYLVKALQKIIPLSKKFLQILPESKIVSKQIIEDVFGTVEEEVSKTIKLPENIKKSKEEFLQKMDELQNAVNTLMQIDTKLFSSENIINFFTSDRYNQESNIQYTRSTDSSGISNQDPMFYRDIPVETTEEFFQQYSVSLNEEEQKATRGSEIIRKLVDRLRDNLGIPAIVTTAEDARAMLEAYGHSYNNEPGFFFNGEVYIVGDKVTTETVFHEFAHPILKAIASTNMPLFLNLYNKLQMTTEGRQIIEGVKQAYPTLSEGSVDFMEEVLAHALGKKADNINRSIPESTGFTKFIKDLLYAIKQALRSLFKGEKISVENLDVNTTLDELANMLATKSFKINTQVIKQTDFVNFVRNLNNDFVKDVAQIEEKRLRLISKALFAMSKKQRRLLELSNYRETRGILKDELGRSDFSEIISALSAYQIEGAPAFSSPEELETFLNSHALALLNSILRLERGAERILKHFKTFVDQIEDATISNEDKQKALLSAFYLNRVTRDWRTFIEEAKEQLRSANVPSNHEIFGILNNVTETLDRTKKYSDKIYEEGVGEMLTEQLTVLMKNIDDHYESIISNYRAKGASAEIIKLYEDEYDAVRLTPERIKQYLKGELGDAHALNVFLEGFAHAQDPIIMGFSGYVRDRFARMSAAIHNQYYTFQNDILPLVERAGYTSAYSRMTMGKDLLYLDVVERDANGLPTKTVWKYISPFKDYKGYYRQLKKDVDQLKRKLDTDNTNEAKLAYVNAIAALNQFESAYMHRKYTAAFYEKERFFQDDIGMEALLRRNRILDLIRATKSGIQNPDDILDNTEKIKQYWKEYKQLSSLYNLDGSPKHPDSIEYKIAERLREYKNFVKKFYDTVPLNGVFENAYLNFVRNLRLQGKTEDEVEAETQRWLSLNTVKKLNSNFYDTRAQIFNELRRLSENDPNQSRISEIFDEINKLLSNYRDDNGNPEGTSVPISVANRIKELEDEFEALKDSAGENFGKLSKQEREVYDLHYADYNKYLNGDTSVYSTMSQEEIDDILNFMAYVENKAIDPIINDLVADFTATNGRDPNPSELTDIRNQALSVLRTARQKKLLITQLMDLQTRVFTEDYVDMVNSFVDASQEAKDFLAGAINLPDSGFSADDIKSLYLITVLPKMLEINPEIMHTDASGNSTPIKFSDWFNNNHNVKVWEGNDGSEQVKYTPTRVWTRIQPNDDDFYEKTTFTDPETGDEIKILGIPSLEYTTRVVKDSYIDDNGNEVQLKTKRLTMLECIRQGISIENATIDMHGDWLPRQNVAGSPYINSKFNELRTNSPAKFDLLIALLKKHLEIQEDIPYDSRLDLEYERYRASQYETVTSKTQEEGGGNPISRYFRNMREYFRKTADNFENGLNMEEREMFVKADLFDDEYAKVPITGMYMIKPDLVSMDMLTSISRYMQSAIKQKTLIEMLPMARVLQKITVQNPPYETREGVMDSLKKMRLANKLAASVATPFGAKGQNFRAMALNAWIEKEFEGKNVSGWGSDTLSNFANTLLSISSKTFFSFNIPAAIKNSMGARWQSLIQAAAGNNFNSKDYAAGTLWANKVTSEITLQIHKFGNKSLNYQLVELMDPTQDRLTSGIKEGKGISRSAAKDAFEFKYATNVREWTQLNASLSIFGALLNKTLVEYTDANGIVSKIKYSDAWEVVNGVLKLKDGVDQSYAPGGKNYVKFVKNLHGITNKINGAYDSFNQPLASRYLLYKMIMHLKKYFMELFMERFKFRYSAKHGMIIPRYDGYTDSIGMGYYIEFLRAAKRFFGVYKRNFHNLTDTEKQAAKKVMMEGGMLILFNVIILGLIFGWDDDDEEKYAKLRKKSDALPLPFVTDNPDRDFRLNGWFSNHLLNLAMQIESENDSWIPAPGLGLNDYADIMLLDSVALSATIDKYKDIINQLYNMADYAVTGDTDALYKRDAGPYEWQEEGKFKFWNHLGKLLTFTGTTVEPVKSIENLKKREQL
jgi:hypothetical protein